MATIDERLAFLLQSTESLHASTQELHATVSNLVEAQSKTQTIVISIADAIDRLTRIAENHEDRIDDLEGK